jgi:hypothetical protein
MHASKQHAVYNLKLWKWKLHIDWYKGRHTGGYVDSPLKTIYLILQWLVLETEIVKIGLRVVSISVSKTILYD